MRERDELGTYLKGVILLFIAAPVGGVIVSVATDDSLGVLWLFACIILGPLICMAIAKADWEEDRTHSASEAYKKARYLQKHYGDRS